MSKVFFTNSGTEAIEGALKVARKYAYLKDPSKDYEFIAMNHSFHGRSQGALSVTGNAHYQDGFVPVEMRAVFADFNDLDDVKSKITDKTCGIICEVVQGEGGIYPAKKEFLEGLRKLCDEKDILLIFDEVQCGMGRTGTIMTYFQYDILPDIVCLAKGIGCGVPVGAFVANAKFAKAMEPGDHGSTYGGNPLVTAAVSTVFDILKKDSIVENCKEVSEYLLEELDKVVKDYDCVVGHRGLGLMQGIVLNVPAKKYVQALLDEGVIVVTAGEKVIRLLPPLVITKEHVDEFITKLRKVLG